MRTFTDFHESDEHMAREEERLTRSQQEPIVGGLPAAPGILTALRLTPGLGFHLRGVVEELLVNDYPGATLTRAEREMLATAVSAANDCFYCMDTHGAFASELLERSGVTNVASLIEGIKCGVSDGVSDKMRALLHVARTVGRGPLAMTSRDIATARDAGATDADTQLAVLIASAFSMYNRMVDGFRAKTPASVDAYRARAIEIAEHGYSDPRVTSVPS
ncbi:MAG TPA: carboxymuconolactone decarboxylase family protein [Gemmatimonadaceae bacterium]|nr:carboxymuconolactone decarboxylase family protein [Gemmatimonadaceae bacterium]